MGNAAGGEGRGSKCFIVFGVNFGLVVGIETPARVETIYKKVELEAD